MQDDESQRLAVELKQAVKETGLAVTGPNCLGNLSAGENLFTNIDDRIVHPFYRMTISNSAAKVLDDAITMIKRTIAIETR